MKVELINKHGLSWTFPNRKEAKKHLKKGTIGVIKKGILVVDEENTDDYGGVEGYSY